MGMPAPLYYTANMVRALAKADRFTKRRLYQEVGVPVYWMVDADEKVVEVWTPDATFPLFERDQLVWHPKGAGAPLIIPCAELFKAG